MQTFLPYPDFQESAQVLDTRRLGKQRVECLQILNTLFGDSDGWENHPAVKMWDGHEGALLLYAYAICEEWVARGHNDSVKDSVKEYEPAIKDSAWFDPPWIGMPELHESHQGNLVRKDPEFYSPRFPEVEPMEGYVWPIKETSD